MKISSPMMERQILDRRQVDPFSPTPLKDLPLRWNPVLVHHLHGGNVHPDEPHGRGRQTDKHAADGLRAPALGIADVTRPPKDDGAHDPGPEELSDDGGPPLSISGISTSDRVLRLPLPALTHGGQLLHRGPVYLGAWDAPGAMKLAGNEPHEHGER